MARIGVNLWQGGEERSKRMEREKRPETAAGKHKQGESTAYYGVDGRERGGMIRRSMISRNQMKNEKRREAQGTRSPKI